MLTFIFLGKTMAAFLVNLVVILATIFKESALVLTHFLFTAISPSLEHTDQGQKVDVLIVFALQIEVSPNPKSLFLCTLAKV